MFSNFEAGPPPYSRRGRLRPFKELAAFNAGPSADEGNEAGCIHGSHRALADDVVDQRACLGRSNDIHYAQHGPTAR